MPEADGDVRAALERQMMTCFPDGWKGRFVSPPGLKNINELFDRNGNLLKELYDRHGNLLDGSTAGRKACDDGRKNAY